MVSVGVVANPASGRDVRRLVSGASVFDKAEKGAMVHRLMAGRRRGGDGTHRVVAAHCGDLPLCALSTGTNNAFPELREATVAGMATGLVVTGRLPGHPDRVASRTLVAPAGLGEDINPDDIDGFVAAERRRELRGVLELLFAILPCRPGRGPGRQGPGSRSWPAPATRPTWRPPTRSTAWSAASSTSWKGRPSA
jgi:hypothetical protein